MATGDKTETRTGYVPDTSLARYRYTNRYGLNIVNQSQFCSKMMKAVTHIVQTGYPFLEGPRRVSSEEFIGSYQSHNPLPPT
jgi:hypothetical protein